MYIKFLKDLKRNGYLLEFLKKILTENWISRFNNINYNGFFKILSSTLLITILSCILDKIINESILQYEIKFYLALFLKSYIECKKTFMNTIRV